MAHTFSLTATSAQFGKTVAMLHSDAAIGTRITELITGYSDAASEFARSNNRTALETILLSVKDKDNDGMKIKSGIRAGFDAYGKGYTPADFPGKKGGFKALNEVEQAPYIAGHGAMCAAFETAMQGYGVKPVISEEVKAERKIKKETRAAEKLNESIKALGLVAPESIRPLDNMTMLSAVIDSLQAGMYSATDIHALMLECDKALTIIETANSIKITKADKAKADKAKADKAKAKAKAEFDAKPDFEQTAILSATM